jgi:hypothetical protein
VDRRVRQKYDIRSFAFEEQGRENLAKVEAIATWLKTNVRDFNLVVEPINTDYLARGIGVPNNPFSYPTRYAVKHINDGTYDRICHSLEWENDGAANGGTVTVRRNGGLVAREVFVAEAARGRIDFPLIDMDYTQAHALYEMPSQIVDLVWDKQDTGMKSMKRHYFAGLLQEGKTPAEAGAIAKLKCMLPNGKWQSMKTWILGQEPNDSNTWDMPTWPSSYEA